MEDRYIAPKNPEYVFLQTFILPHRVKLKMIQLVRFPFCLFLALLFRHVLPASLPAYEGPNGVGIIDVEVPVSNPRNVTDTTLKSNGEAAFQVC